MRFRTLSEIVARWFRQDDPAKTEARTTEVFPVIVARWFREGIAYAYSSDVDSALLAAVVAALGPVSQRDRDHTFQLTLPDGRVLVGARDTDTTPLDPLAAGRRPYVIRTAVCPAQSSIRDIQAALIQLRELPLPGRPGLSHDLTVRLVPPSRPSPVPVPSERPVSLLPWVFVLSFVTIDLVLWQVGWSDGAFGLLIRTVVLLGLLGVNFLRRRRLTAQQLGHLEWQWYEDAEPRQESALRLQAGARVVFPNGRESTPGQELLVVDLGVRRTPSTPVFYQGVDVTPTGAVVTGTEVVRFQGQEMSVSFTRRYTHWKGRWWLNYAQWTVVNPGSPPVRCGL